MITTRKRRLPGGTSWPQGCQKSRTRPGAFCLHLPAERRIEVEENPLTGKRRKETLVGKYPQPWPPDQPEILSRVIYVQQNQG